jgi:hypothetical protein
MSIVLSYRHRDVTIGDVEFLRDLIAAHPDASRRALSKKVCAAWNWVQPNGALRDMVCRSLMLELHRAGHIELPPVRRRPRNNLALRKKPESIEVDRTPIQSDLRSLGALTIKQVRRTPDEALVNSLIEMHHYLGYTQPVGEQLKHLVSAGDRPVACFTWSSAPRHLGPRDRFIGWSKEARLKNIRFIAYNSRFLILPWVKVPHLASHLLGRMVRALPSDWQQVYDHPVHFAETFVYPAKFRGTCYRAANWVDLGQTTGRGKDDQTKQANRPLKDVLGYPLTKCFRELLSELP